MEKPILKIRYDAFTSNYDFEDFMYMDEFKENLSKEYNHFIKPKPAIGRGGNAYELAVEFFLNTDLQTYLTIIGGYIGGKVIDKFADGLLDKYLFKPFFEIFKNFSKKHNGVEIWEFKIELYNSVIIIYKLNGFPIIEIFDKILETIYHKLNKLVINDELFPSVITIPVFAETIKESIVFRPPLGIGETKEDITENDYFKLWKLDYEFTHTSKVYDLVNDILIDNIDYVDENEFYTRWQDDSTL
ncbi:hypothetical protein AD998_06355 [bacterium 336/3]|nr:hypothetical protein AD998_06355 [bacterium 336/3]